jgi:hypothetical protein
MGIFHYFRMPLDLSGPVGIIKIPNVYAKNEEITNNI